MDFRRILKLIAISAVLVCPFGAAGQDAGDFVSTAIDLSRTNPGGSARILGMGGAQTALGGDISSAYSNPAGLGFFSRSEFSFSPVFNYVGAETDYLGNTTNDGRLNFNFGNLGAVIKGKKSSGDFKGGSFGISINRVADFQKQITYEANSSNQLDNTGQIIFDPNQPADFAEFAALSSFIDGNGNINFDNDFAELAYETFLISDFELDDGTVFFDRDYYAVDENGDYFLDDDGNLIPAYTEPDFPTFQAETIRSTGAMYQTSLAYGINYQDKLYFGANLGILTLTQEVTREYSETPEGADLNNLLLVDEYELNGTGINATFGFIGRPVNTVLLAVSYTTPSILRVDQIRSIQLTANFINATETFGFDYEPFTYNLTTPSRLNLGGTYFFGKSGLITASAERVNFGGANFSNSSFGDVSFSEANNDLDRLDAIWNYRVGAEFRHDIFRFRGGFSLNSDPSDNEIDEMESRISVGGGIRTKSYFADMAIVASTGRNSTVSPYQGQQALVNNQNVLVAFTVGFFF